MKTRYSPKIFINFSCLIFNTLCPNTANPKFVNSFCKKNMMKISRHFDTKIMYEDLI